MKIFVFVNKIFPLNKTQPRAGSNIQKKYEIIKWLKINKITNHIINDDLSVDVNGDVDISQRQLSTIPIKFGIVHGNFYCQLNRLTSLVGAPKIVDGDFVCYSNNLINLAGSPKAKSLNYCYNKIISLIEIIDCDFKQQILFQINKTDFLQKELIVDLDKYYSPVFGCYALSCFELRSLLMPYIQKPILLENVKKHENSQAINNNSNGSNNSNGNKKNIFI